MNWKHIKTVLIFLFLIINIYLIYSSPSSHIGISSDTVFDSKTISKTVEIIEKNFDISVDAGIIPKRLTSLKNINAANIIYTEAFMNSGYSFNLENGVFSADIATDTYSYNEAAAKEEIKQFMQNLGIAETNYNLSFSKSDNGLVCTASEKLSEYPVFNGRITAIFEPSLMHIKGRWHMPESEDTESDDASLKMISISGVLIDAAQQMQNDMSGKKITDIQYGYFVSYYDENTVSKSASAIPCYMVETDAGYKYYYDAINGKTLKQEE